jgi:2-amino-4-hydroxy-6-hydroxymethyldihydropteridine diphosphokinase
MSKHHVAIALGSNLGDRLEHLRFGRQELLARGDLQRVRSSPVYETAPVDCPPGSGSFLNAVLLGETIFDPEEWLDLLLAIEEDAGRIRTGAFNAPRPLDLDLLSCGDFLRDTPRLVIPHPGLRSRKFVLQPLSDLTADLLVPGLGCTVSQMLGACSSAEPDPSLYLQDW